LWWFVSLYTKLLKKWWEALKKDRNDWYQPRRPKSEEKSGYTSAPQLPITTGIHGSQTERPYSVK
jgi:hypothetical protein